MPSSAHNDLARATDITRSMVNNPYPAGNYCVRGIRFCNHLIRFFRYDF
jgi:hypothetical protein